MTLNTTSFADLSDDDLLAEVQRLAATERQATAALIRSLIELDARRLYLGEGCSSLFSYCTQVLLSESAAYNRIEVARAARRFPQILTALEDDALTLTAVRLLAPHVTPDNCASFLASARHQSERDIERLVATLSPRPAVSSVVRRLPEARDAATGLAARLAQTASLAPHAAAAPTPMIARCPRRSQPHRVRRSRRWPRSATRSSSRSLARRTTRCVACRISFGTRFRTVTRPRSSTAP